MKIKTLKIHAMYPVKYLSGFNPTGIMVVSIKNSEINCTNSEPEKKKYNIDSNREIEDWDYIF
jgi:hypothetical protein